ncbi:MAG: response regulator [Desulfoprunum sp.]|jgi:DNA-binding NtrC family response regulator|uniref:response regulator n=1 Tax=Desulfoprunum sp. TaxID=2020866 RepID=UPI003C733E4C
MTRSSSATSLLLVDDEIEFTEIMAQRLHKRGFPITTATEGATALRRLEEHAIDVVILDVAMPGMNGIDILNAIGERQPLVEVIMLTGQATVGTAVEAIRHGAFNYLKKPCEIEDLIAQIDSAMDRRMERQKKVLEVRMTPYLSPERRAEMISAILKS